MEHQPISDSSQEGEAPLWGRSVRWRIVAGYLAVLLLGLAAAGLTWWQVGRLLTAVDTLETVSNRVAVATDVRHASTALLADVSRLLPLEDSELFSAEVAASLEQLQDSQARLQALMADTEDQETLATLQAVNQRVQNIANVTGTMVRQAENDQWPNVSIRVGVLNRDQQQVVNEVNSFVDQVRAQESRALAQVTSSRRAAALYPALAGLLALLLAAVSITQLTRSIAGPVERLTAGAARLAAGMFDEPVPVDSQDEMGQLAVAFNQMASQLQSSYSILETRVRERTRDLALAASIGQRLSEVRDLDQLANEAVERIRDRFDLYYVQIYLIDPAGQSLGLYAGTGEIGAELAERGHRLPIDANSVNGMAAQSGEAVVIADTTESALFRSNPLLPETRTELAVPLVSGDRVLGVLDLQGRRAGELSAETLPAFEVLAGQLAIAIQNARLFQGLEQARAELAASRQETIRAGWDAFLNAIDREEQLEASYVGDGEAERAALTGENTLTTSITLNNEPIGAIELEAAPDLHWSGEQIEIVNNVAQQVAQQVENLRLLAEAQRYRQEAEDAIRRLTREGWESFTGATPHARFAYQYAGQQVQPLESTSTARSEARWPLRIQGEPVGELALDNAIGDEREAEFAAAVADRLGAHIENLRLSQQTEAALGEAEQRTEELRTINRVVTEIGSTLDLRESLQIVVRELVAATGANQARVALLNEPGTALSIVAESLDPDLNTGSALGLQIPVAGNLLTQEVLETRQPVVVADPQHDPRLEPMHALFREQGIETMIILPILAGNRVIGTVGVDILVPERSYTEAEERLAATIVLQAATAIQNANLFDQVQESLALTERLYAASERINSAGPDIGTAVAALAEAARVPAVNRVLLFDFEVDGEGQIVAAEIVANWYSGEGPPPSAVGTRYEQAALRALSLLQTEDPITVADTATDELLDPMTSAVFQKLAVPSAAVIPLWVGGRQIGSLLLETADYHYFTESEIDPYVALTGQLAVAVDRQRLVDETRRRADRERLINVIGQKIQDAPTIERAMQVAVGELGRALKARRAVVELDLARPANGNGRKVTDDLAAPEVVPPGDTSSEGME